MRSQLTEEEWWTTHHHMLPSLCARIPNTSKVCWPSFEHKPNLIDQLAEEKKNGELSWVGNKTSHCVYDDLPKVRWWLGKRLASLSQYNNSIHPSLCARTPLKLQPSISAPTNYDEPTHHTEDECWVDVEGRPCIDTQAWWRFVRGIETVTSHSLIAS